MNTDSYHHGDLRATVLREAAKLVVESGVDALSLRELARLANVSHAAPAHHFGGKRGLLTALATEGFDLLAETLSAAGDNFLNVAVAYVRFATAEHPGHYAVMFLGTAIDMTDPALVKARDGAETVLLRGAATVRPRGDSADTAYAPLAAFSLVHGLATLWNNQAIAPRYRPLGVEQLTREIGSLLFAAA
jgi:AcrR family transcriptional regulator